MAKRSATPSADTPDAPSAEARKAVELWGLAFRYASSAVRPVAKGAAHNVKERVAAVASSDHSLKDRINPSKTEKGGKPGDAADAVLGKMGTPGKLAAKASLGSRVIGRLAPSLNDDEIEPEAEADEELTDEVDAPEDDEQAVDESEAPTAESEAEVPADESDEDSDASEEEPEAEASEDEPEADASEEESDEEPDDDRDRPRGEAKPVEPHPGADPLHTDFEHAYSDEVENYEHQDAYAPTR